MAEDTLLSIDVMSNDQALMGRCRAAAARKDIEGFECKDPTMWVAVNRYAIVAAPGWGAAWQYAVDSGNESPGDDPTVITDPMILAQVEALLTPVAEDGGET